MNNKERAMAWMDMAIRAFEVLKSEIRLGDKWDDDVSFLNTFSSDCISVYRPKKLAEAIGVDYVTVRVKDLGWISFQYKGYTFMGLGNKRYKYSLDEIEKMGGLA